MDLRPIKTEEDYKNALREIESLFDAAPGTAESDRLEVLSTLVDAYEKIHFPVELPDPIEAIHYYMEARGWSQQDLEPCLGGRAGAFAVLSRQRFLTLDMIRKLNQELGIPAEILIQPYGAVQASA